jgi:hypothetical protein
LAPQVNGATYRFKAAALYNGSAILRDQETDSFWHHLTGECLDGRHRGYQLEVTGSLKYMTARQALQTYPQAHLARARLSFFGMCFAQFAKWVTLRRRGFLPPFFYKSMGDLDPRLSPLELGLGVRVATGTRFYPFSTIQACNRVLLDTLQSRRLVVYIDPQTDTPQACYTQAQEAHWQGEVLHLDTDEMIKAGQLYTASGHCLTPERPLVMFIRWYAFSATFPTCSIYAEE